MEYIIFMTRNEELLYNANSLYDGFKKSMKGSAWKEQPQRFEMNLLSEISKLQKELKAKTYKTSPTSDFIVNERGKTRKITGIQMRDRVVRHSLCDEVLLPQLKKHLIYDNGASLKKKGIKFTRNRLDKHLHKYFREHGSNDGYILLMDFSKFYDNIDHKKALVEIAKNIKDDYVMWLLSLIFDDFKVDVSYMSAEEYKNCINKKFDSLEYYHNNYPKCGDKYMRKSIDIGDQVSQVVGIYYPTRIDTYVKYVKGFKYYGRYMDDSYVICESKEKLKQLLSEIEKLSREMGLFINTKKTHIAKLSDTFKFLQIKYFVTDTGKVVKRINPKRVTAMRRKLKKLQLKVHEGVLTYGYVFHVYWSWMNNYAPLMSKIQRKHMIELYNKLFVFDDFGNEPGGKHEN